ncbi:ABC transporter substrate-binding protein [Paracoccus aminophilus]|uniref:ABC-type dipeptide transport system, extracellular solute-binding protein n=1 Tax=Paracoccus aminophilus JCM 7686 TaxID=1367847 RepID=S5XZP8_PARAH|nr:ABC transporter substrate-binding protein [Paracoccus aminophilus]AGT10767.1 ABC-type dipeptide transport system, extracellular solute-binding protein [Paracoccus aminophilus JCM 7686]
MTVNRRAFLSSTAAALALLAASPKFALAQTTPERGGTLRVALDQAISVIHPLLTRVNPEYLATELLYSNLTRLTTKMEVEPDLATAWQSNDELTVWTFTLREGLKFHDGAPCTSEDVVATFEAILNPDVASSARNNVGPIEKIEAVDPVTLRFTLTEPYADLPAALAFNSARIIPASVARGDLNSLRSTANGTGPFKLVSYEPDRLMVVERNPDFYDPARPYLDRIELHVFPDLGAQTSSLLSGDIDLVATIGPNHYMRLDGQQGVNVLRAASGQFCNVNFGTDLPPFNDVRLRKALALTVDREAMVDFMTEGFGTKGNDTPINESYPFFAPVTQRERDIEAAKALLAEAGYPNGIEVELIASDRPALRSQLAVALKDMAKEAGITINVVTMPHATYLDQVWTKGSFYVGFYNMQPTPDAIFKLLFTSDAAWNETRWNNPKFDDLVKRARATTAVDERTKLYTEAQALMTEEVPSIIPAFFDVLGAKRDWVDGYEIHPRGSVYRLDFAWLTAASPTRKG